MLIQYKVFESEVKAADDEALVIKHIISSETQDRGGDIMRVAGMRIVGKPVVLMLHGRGPMGSEPVGKPLSVGPDTWKGRPVVMAETQFFPDETGRRLYEKAKNGYLPNWSIGYSVEEAIDIVKNGKYNGREVTKWTLLEWSPVGVPMQPDAQTIKDFLDADDKGERPEIKEEAHWFGIADGKECKGCGQECEKHEETPPADPPAPEGEKAPAHPFKIEEDPPPPDDVTTLKCATCDELLWRKWGGEAPPFKPEKVYCKKGCEVVVKTPEPEGPTLKDLCDSIQIVADNVSRLGLDFIKATERIDGLSKAMEPLLKTLPPEPEGGKEGDEEHHDNPPEKKTPPRLVIVREEETPEAKRKALNAQILAIAREALGDSVRQEIDRMKGRVP